MVVCLGFTIDNPKYLESLGGFDPPPFRFDGCRAKILSISLGIFVCILTRSVPLGVYGFDLKPTMVWVGVIVNGVFITVTIEWRNTTKNNGTNLTGSIMKLEVVS
jgi:hypothetical protein